VLDDLLILYSEGKSAVAVVDGPKACFHTGVDGVDNHVVGGDMALQLEEVDQKICKSFLKYVERRKVRIVCSLSKALDGTLVECTITWRLVSRGG